MGDTLSAEKDSNAARKASHDFPTQSVGMQGFTDYKYPTEGPATKNSDISTLGKNIGLGNDGTSRGSYVIQVDEPSAMTGETGTGNKK